MFIWESLYLFFIFKGQFFPDTVFMFGSILFWALWTYYPTPFWAARFLIRNTLRVLWGSLVCDSSLFSFFFQNSVFLLTFDKLIKMCLGMDFFEFFLGSPLDFLILNVYFFPRFGKFSAIISLNKHSASLSLSLSLSPLSPFWDSHNACISPFDGVP